MTDEKNIDNLFHLQTENKTLIPWFFVLSDWYVII